MNIIEQSVLPRPGVGVSYIYMFFTAVYISISLHLIYFVGENILL